MADSTWPISVKGILERTHKVLLMLNERQEWELPGGHIELGESPQEALKREFSEETGLDIAVESLAFAEFYTPPTERGTVLLLFYRVSERDDGLEEVVSAEHQDAQWMDLDRLPDNLPPVYHRGIHHAGHGLAGLTAQYLNQRLKGSGSDRMQRLAVPSVTEPVIGVGRAGEVGLYSESPLRGSIVALHEAFLDGSARPVQMMEERIEKARHWQELTPIFSSFDPEAALDAARMSEERYQKKRPLSVLDGVAVGLKDLIDVRGAQTRAGSLVTAGVMPAQADADVTAALRRSGANFSLGKLNLHEFAYGPTGDISHWGAVGNPFDLSRMTGGSSSGSAAAVAVGIVSAALGTDTGGSVRIPAGLTGISGLKPTYGRLSGRGVAPLSWSLDHVGPMARTVSDIAAVWQVLTGATPAQLPERLRIFWPDDPQIQCWDPSLQHYWESTAAAALQVLGAEVVRGRLVDLTPIWLAQSIIIGSEALSWHWPTLVKQRDQYQPQVAERLEKGGAHLAVEYVQSLRYRQQAAQSWDEWMMEFDAVLLPTTPITAPLLHTRTVPSLDGSEEDVRAVLTRFTAPFNFLGVPALSIPGGVHQGLPVGMQWVGRRHQDELLLALGQTIQERLPDLIPSLA